MESACGKNAQYQWLTCKTKNMAIEWYKYNLDKKIGQKPH